MKPILVVSAIFMVVNDFLSVSIRFVFFLLNFLIRELFFLLKITAVLPAESNDARLNTTSAQDLLYTVSAVIEELDNVEESAQEIVVSKLIAEAQGIPLKCPSFNQILQQVAVELTEDLLEQVSQNVTRDPQFINNTIQVLYSIYDIIKYDSVHPFGKPFSIIYSGKTFFSKVQAVSAFEAYWT